jgi:hypothetical protein
LKVDLESGDLVFSEVAFMLLKLLTFCNYLRGRSVYTVENKDDLLESAADLLQSLSFLLEGLAAEEEVVQQETKGSYIFLGHLVADGCNFFGFFFGKVKA